MSEQERGWEGQAEIFNSNFFNFYSKITENLGPPFEKFKYPPPPQHTNGKNVLDQRMNNLFVVMFIISMTWICNKLKLTGKLEY